MQMLTTIGSKATCRNSYATTLERFLGVVDSTDY